MKSIVTATIEHRDGKPPMLCLRGVKSNDANEFYQTLPAGKFQGTYWTAEATPSSCWRLLNQCPIDVEASQDILDLAAAFAASLRPESADQAAVRAKDSWQHQVTGYHFVQVKAGAMLAMGMGCGKSKPTVELIINSDAMLTLIMAPRSVLAVWRREFDLWGCGKADVLVLDKGSVSQKVKQADAFVKKCSRLKRPCVIVNNYDSVWREDFAEWALAQKWDWVVADESHRLKGHDTAVSKFAGKIAKVARRRLALTGTPMPHSPLDLFGQYRFLDRGIFGTWFHHFRSRYAKMNQLFPSKVDAWLNQEELKERFALIAYRVTAEEVLDLPEFNHHERRVTLSPAARKAYEELEDDLITQVGTGTLTATNALTRLLRLQQITSGFAVVGEPPDQSIVELDNAKKSELFELLSDIDKTDPVIVFCRFRHDLTAVEQVANTLMREYGELSGRRRDGIDNRGCMTAGKQVVGVQIQSGGVGIDLTAARYAVYFSIGFSLGDYEQSLARLHRPGQKRAVHYFHLIANNTKDDVVYSALRSRSDLVLSVLEALKHGKTS